MPANKVVSRILPGLFTFLPIHLIFLRSYYLSFTSIHTPNERMRCSKLEDRNATTTAT